MKEKEKEFLIACKIGNFEYIQYLLTHVNFKKEININIKNEAGRNALLYVAKLGRVDIAKYLLTSTELESHVNLYEEDINNENCLQYACNYWNIEMIKFFIIDMKMEITEEKLDWLKIFDSFNHISLQVVKLIESRDLNKKLNENLFQNDVNIKNIKI